MGGSSSSQAAAAAVPTHKQRSDEYGITTNEKYLDVLKRLLGLYQKQWKLLDDTLIKMKELGGECELCYYDVKRFENEINRSKMNNSGNNDIKPVPNTKLINKSMNSLTNWMKNKDEVKDVLKEWIEFKNEVEMFKLDWDVVKDGIIEEIRNTHCRHSAQKKMIFGIEKMEKRLQEMLKSSFRIESLCDELNKSMVDHGFETKVIQTFVDYQEWDDNISNYLRRIEQSLNKFKLNCYQIAKEITQTQQSIIKIEMCAIC